MNTSHKPSNNPHESISLLADGEATPAQADAALAALATQEGRAQWAMLHQIGDALRSDELATQTRPGFLTDLFAQLDQEPAIVAPVIARPAASGLAGSAADQVPDAPARPAHTGLARRFAMPGMVAAAAAAFALFGGSQLMTAQAPAVLPASAPASGSMLASAGSALALPGETARNVRQASAEQGDLLRDPDIDQYLLAHQRFSPSPYSTAQYARSPAFANESVK